MTPSLNAIVPMACVTAAGIAAMVAESFRDPGERMPIAGLGVVGLLGAAVATVLLWNHNAPSFGLVAGRQLRPVRHRHADRGRPAVAGDLGPDDRARAAAAAASTTR